MHTQKGLAPLIWVIIVALLLGIGYMAYKTAPRKAPGSSPDDAVVSQIPLKSVDIEKKTEEVRVAEIDTSDWETYRNEKYRFEFKYPSSWYWSGGNRDYDQYLICLNPKGSAGDCSGLLTVSWGVRFEDRFQAMKDMFSENSKVAESMIEVDGVKGRLLIIGSINGFSRSAFWEKGGYIYNLSTGANKESLFGGLISTFKFTK